MYCLQYQLLLYLFTFDIVSLARVGINSGIEWELSPIPDSIPGIGLGIGIEKKELELNWN